MTTALRVLVTGGRDFADAAMVRAALDAIHPIPGIAYVIEGGALGADRLAKQWARDHDVQVATFQARWDLNGTAAGPIRNSNMLRVGRPDLVLAFPGGNGTADMVRKARAAGVEVLEFGISGPSRERTTP